MDREKLIHMLSAQEGGSVFLNKSKLELGKYGILFISLGGMGAKTVNAIKQEVDKRLKPTNRIKYLAIDTAQDDMKGVTYPIGALDVDETAELYKEFGAPNLSVPNEKTRDWLEPGLTGLELDGNGAKGVRQAGRAFLANFEAYNAIRKKINNAVNDLVALCPYGVRVYVIAGISGGTGSGTIIDMGYMVRECIAAKGDIKCTGLFYMADIQAQESWAVTSGEDRRLWKNCYAALKEIDYFMNIEQRGGYFQPLHSIEKVYSNIFDDVILVSSRTNNGATTKIIFRDSAEAIKATAKALTVLIANLNLTASDGTQLMSLDSALSNKVSTTNAWISKNAGAYNLPGWAPMRYSTLSFGSLYIPRDELMAYCANMIFSKMVKRWKQLVGKDMQIEINSALAQVGMDSLKSMIERVYQQVVDEERFVPSPSAEFYPSLPPLRIGAVRDVEETEAYVNDKTRGVCAVIQSRMKLPETVDHFTQPIFELIDKAFMDKQKGPYYAINLLSANITGQGGGIMGILYLMDSLKGQIEEQKTRLLEAKRAAEGQISAKKQSLLGLSPSSQEDIDEFCSFLRIRAKANCKLKIIEYIESFIDSVYDKINEKNTRLYSIYTVLLDEFPAVLESDAAYAANSTRTKAGTQETFTFDIANMGSQDPSTKVYQNFFKTVADSVDEEDTQEKCDAFVHEVILKLKEFDEGSSEPVNEDKVAELVRTYFTKFFGDLAKDTVEKLCALAFTTPADANVGYSNSAFTPQQLTSIWNDSNDQAKRNLLQKTAAQMSDMLSRKVVPFLATNAAGAVSINNMPNWRYVCMPDEAKNLITLQGQRGILSNGGNEVFCFQIVLGIPLFMLYGLDVGHYNYLNEPASEIGKHLNKSWRTEFPDPFGYPAAKYFSLADGDPQWAAEKEKILSIQQDLTKLYGWGLLKTGKQCLTDYGHTQAEQITRGHRTSVAIENSDIRYYLMGREITGVASSPDFEKAVETKIAENIRLGASTDDFNIFELLKNEDGGFKRPKSLNLVYDPNYDIDVYSALQAANPASTCALSFTDSNRAPLELAYQIFFSKEFSSLLEQTSHSFAKARNVVDDVLTKYRMLSQFKQRTQLFIEALRYEFVYDDPDAECWLWMTVPNQPIKKPLFLYKNAPAYIKEYALYHAYVAFNQASESDLLGIKTMIEHAHASQQNRKSCLDIRNEAIRALGSAKYLGNFNPISKKSEIQECIIKSCSFNRSISFSVPKIITTNSDGAIVNIDDAIDNLELFYKTMNSDDLTD